MEVQLTSTEARFSCQSASITSTSSAKKASILVEGLRYGSTVSKEVFTSSKGHIFGRGLEMGRNRSTNVRVERSAKSSQAATLTLYAIDISDAPLNKITLKFGEMNLSEVVFSVANLNYFEFQVIAVLITFVVTTTTTNTWNSTGHIHIRNTSIGISTGHFINKNHAFSFIYAFVDLYHNYVFGQ